MNRILSVIACFLILLVFADEAKAQVFNPTKGCVVDANGDCLPNTILGALPFLRIVPDAAAGAMGDTGIGTDNGVNALHFNASKLPFMSKERGLSFTYTPWLTNIGLTDVYLIYLSGFMKIDDLQSVGASVRFFSLGDITFTDAQGDPSGQGQPREWEVAFGYTRKLANNFSAGLTAKYMLSDLATGQTVEGINITTATSFAADLSFTYNNEVQVGLYDSRLRIGAAISNIGNKVTYTRNTTRDFIPTNFGLGAALEMDFDEFNTFSFALDINKLMIPTPIAQNIVTIENGVEVTSINPEYDPDGDGIAEYREKALFSGIIESWGDAPGGFSEELQEFNYSVGVEYWYDKQFAVRAGYYFENPLKGDRQFLTVGAGLKYNVFGFDISYLVPTSNTRNPLDNTLRFSLLFDFEVFQSDR